MRPQWVYYAAVLVVGARLVSTRVDGAFREIEDELVGALLERVRRVSFADLLYPMALSLADERTALLIALCVMLVKMNAVRIGSLAQKLLGRVRWKDFAAGMEEGKNGVSHTLRRLTGRADTAGAAADSRI